MFKIFNFQKFFFRFPGKSTSEKTIPPKKIEVLRLLTNSLAHSVTVDF